MTPIVMIVDSHFFPGLLALLETISLYGRLPKHQPFVVLEGNPLSKRDKKLLERFDMNIKCEPFRDHSEISVDWFSFPDFPPWWLGWLRSIMKKLYLFDMTEYKKIVWLDSDMICLGDLNPLFEMDAFAARPDYGKVQSKYFNDDMFCTGCMVIEPSHEDFLGMLQVLKDRPDFLEVWPNYGDQAIINAYFYGAKRDKIHMMDLKWGVNKRTFEHHPEEFDKQMKDARLLHYVGEKPWQGPDEKYEKVNKIWWGAWTKVKERMTDGSKSGNGDIHR